MSDSAALLDFPKAESAPPAWGLARRILFRFVCAYLVLYNLPFPLEHFTLARRIVEAYTQLWHAVVPWVGKQVFGLEITVRRSGSGDKTYDYVQVFCFLVLAALVAAVWTLLDRRRREHSRADVWLRTYVRFSLAVVMITYGAYKLIPSQFAPPDPTELVETFGDSSPMGLLWTFMGASMPYTIFTGFAEMLGGLLLIARRTAALGALVCIGVMSNVVMLNLSYDVPVKLFSSHLLLMAVFLLLPDLRRLVGQFVLNREVEPRPILPLFRRPLLHRGALAVRTAFFLTAVCMALWTSYDSAGDYGIFTPKPPFYGMWNVEHFELDGRVRPALITDGERWRRVFFEYPEYVGIQGMRDRRVQYEELALHAGAKTMTMTSFRPPRKTSVFSFRSPGPGLLALEGTYGGKAVRARLRRADESHFLLVSRGFHWINEWPMNR